MFKQVIFIEDGSINVDELKSQIDTTKNLIVVYRAGSVLPTIEECDIASSEEFEDNMRFTINKAVEAKLRQSWVAINTQIAKLMTDENKTECDNVLKEIKNIILGE